MALAPTPKPGPSKSEKLCRLCEKPISKARPAHCKHCIYCIVCWKERGGKA